MKHIKCAMLFLLVLNLFLITSNSYAVPRGTLIEADYLGKRSKRFLKTVRSLINANAIPPAKSDVHFYRIKYSTIGIDGEPVEATGAVIFPDRIEQPQPLPVVVYLHGTIFNASKAPSNSNKELESLICAVAFSSQGYFVVVPDYLGLGKKPTFHPFLHAQSEATASADMLLAAKEFADKQGIQTKDQLFLLGYSQGGHATMALHRYLEANGVQVTAAAPMAGPYDLAKTMIASRLRVISQASSVTTTYVLYAMNHLYHLFDSLAEIIKDPNPSQLTQIFGGRLNYNQFSAMFPPRMQEVLHSNFYLEMMKATEESPMVGPIAEKVIGAFRENNVYDWKPKAPVLLIHARSDDQIPFANSEVALAHFQAVGAVAKIYDLGTGLTHKSAAVPAISQAYLWFTSMQKSFDLTP